MSVARKVRPTYIQSVLSTVLVLTLSLLLSPLTLALTIIAYTSSSIKNQLSAPRRRPVHQKTVLVTGGRANKALTLIRAFHNEGYRVVVAEEAKWGTVACSRFSCATSAYYALPDPHTNRDAYSATMKRIVSAERVDVWVPCSTVHATMIDSEIAKEIREERLGGVNGCDCFIPEPELCGSLHWKDQFEVLCRELKYPVPDSKIVTSVKEAVSFLHSPESLAKGQSYLLKSLTLDDLGRDDFTLLPLSNPEQTEHHLANIPMPITEKDLFLLQRFLRGPEYCTHVAARNGRIVAFVACRSNQLLMRYADVRTLDAKEREVGEGLEWWSQQFLDLYKAKLENEGKVGREYELTGHFSFDFILEKSEGRIYVLECNVRPHTAVVLLSDDPFLASHYLNPPTGDSAIDTARPIFPTSARSWLAHALPLTLARLLPRSVCPLIHPQLLSTIHPPTPIDLEEDRPDYDPTMSPPPSINALELVWRYLVVGSERDGVWDWEDPVPFWVLCHVQWPWLLIRLVWRGVAWSRVNVSTSRVFEC